MIELKFRVWDKEDEAYLHITKNKEDGVVGISPDGKKVLYLEDGEVIILEDVIIEQYTGLKDKNGKEIYEGDIVEQFVCGIREFKGKKCGRRTVWQVRWNETECCFELHYINGSLFGDSMMSSDDEYEVIGNIHESNMEELCPKE